MVRQDVYGRTGLHTSAIRKGWIATAHVRIVHKLVRCLVRVVHMHRQLACTVF